MKNSAFVKYVLDVLSPFGNVKARAMFGGHALYNDGIVFALIIADVVYFKVDDLNRPTYQAYGSKPFTYESKNGKVVAMSYWQVPEDVLEDHNSLQDLVRGAVAAARRSKKNKKIKK